MDIRKKLLRRGICPKCHASHGMGDIDDRGRSVSHICFRCGCETFLVGPRVVCTITEHGLDVAATYKRVVAEMSSDTPPDWYRKMTEQVPPETPKESNALMTFGAIVHTAACITPDEDIPLLLNAVIKGAGHD